MCSKSTPKLKAVGVLVGRVESIINHPSAERIRIAHVAHSKDMLARQIVFGGKLDAVRPGSMVAVAPPTESCRVQGKKMRRRNYRGQASHGQLCSLYELGLIDYDTDEVAVLHPDKKLKVGDPISDLLKRVKTYGELWAVFLKPHKARAD